MFSSVARTERNNSGRHRPLRTRSYLIL